jgi:hypothetical protein
MEVYLMMEVILFLMFQMVLAAKRKESRILPLIAFPSGYLATAHS